MKHLFFFTILIFLLSGCILTKNNFNVEFDNLGNPIQDENCYTVDISGIKGYSLHLYNTSNSPISLFYYNKDSKKWNILYSRIEPNNQIALLEQVHPDVFKYGLLGIFCTDEEKIKYEIYVQKRDIIFGYPIPMWKGESYENILQNKFNNISNSEKKDVLIQELTTYHPNSAGGVDIGINFWNNTQKTIKYVYFDVVPYNRVGDRTVSEIGNKSLASLKITNFINPYQNYSSRWSNVWYNSEIGFCKILKIRIIYSDNSERIINNLDEIESLLNINPITHILYNNKGINIGFYYRNGGVYLFTQTKGKLENLYIKFNTNKKTLRSESRKDLIFNFEDFKEKSDINEINYYETVYPNSLNELLYEINNIDIIYKINNTDKVEIKIDDFSILSSMQDFAYLIENLGLK